MTLLFNYSGLLAQLSNIYRDYAGILGVDYNAKIILKVQSGDAITRDPETGNYVLPDTTTVILHAFLTQKKDPNIDGKISGLAFNRHYMDGWLVSPLTYNYPVDQKLECIIYQDEQEVKGHFIPLDHYPHSMDEESQIRSALGQKICGYFEVLQPSGI